MFGFVRLAAAGGKQITMAIERTLCILKPDALRRNLIGELVVRIEKAGFQVLAARLEQLDAGRAEGFYAEHRGKPFFTGLVGFMTSGPIVPMVLKGENAVLGLRELMGATNPEQAAAGTLRAEFGQSIDVNTIHGSDSPASAAREIAYFFDESQIHDR